MRHTLVCIGAAVMLLAVACGGRGPEDDPILRLSAEESLARGKELLEQEKYSDARPYLLHAFEVEPNSVAGRAALLLAADSFYLDGGQENYVRAESRYRDFLNRFPTSDRADYAQFQIANSLAQRAEPPDRDQTVTRQATEAYQDLLRLFPTSEHVEGAEKGLIEMRNRLAAHEWVVGHFYFRFGMFGAAASRFEYLLERYPEYPEIDRVLFYLGRARLQNQEPTEARDVFRRLREEYPDSPWIAEIPELPRQQREEAASTEAVEEAS